MQRTQHPSNNAVLGAPPGMSIDQCSALPITRLVYSDGTPAVASFWKPTPDELERIKQGMAIRLTVLGHTHPPLLIEVDGDGLLNP